MEMGDGRKEASVSGKDSLIEDEVVPKAQNPVVGRSYRLSDG